MQSERHLLIRFAILVIIVITPASYVSQLWAAESETVFSELVNIRDASPEDFSADVRFAWNFPRAEYVIVSDGEKGNRQSAKGSLNTGRGGFYYFIGVKDNSLNLVTNSSVWKWKHGPGIHGLIHSIGSEDPHTAFATAYHGKLTTRLSKGRIQDHIIDVLQKKKFVVELMDSAKSVVSTKTFNYESTLCEGKDCDKPMNQRDVVRQVAWSVFLDFDQFDSGELPLHLKAVVMKNYRRQDKNWVLDEDGQELATPAAIILCNEFQKGL